MNSQQYISRSKTVAARALGNEMMVMSAVNSTLFTLDEIARTLWEAADGVTPLEDIVLTRICSRYDVTPEVALKDAEAFVEQLVGHGLMFVSDKPTDVSGASLGRS